MMYKIKRLPSLKYLNYVKERLKEENEGTRWNRYIKFDNYDKPVFVSEGIFGEIEAVTTRANKERIKER